MYPKLEGIVNARADALVRIFRFINQYDCSITVSDTQEAKENREFLERHPIDQEYYQSNLFDVGAAHVRANRYN